MAHQVGRFPANEASVPEARVGGCDTRPLWTGYRPPVTRKRSKMFLAAGLITYPTLWDSALYDGGQVIRLPPCDWEAGSLGFRRRQPVQGELKRSTRNHFHSRAGKNHACVCLHTS